MTSDNWRLNWVLGTSLLFSRRGRQDVWSGGIGWQRNPEAEKREAFREAKLYRGGNCLCHGQVREKIIW